MLADYIPTLTIDLDKSNYLFDVYSRHTLSFKHHNHTSSLK